MEEMLTVIDIKEFVADFWPIIIGVMLLGLFVLLATCKVYMKAGREWWEAVLPIYNVLVWFDMIKRSRQWIWIYIPIFVLMFLGEIPYAIASISNLIFTFWITYELMRRFGKGLVFTFGTIILPFIYWPILAWGNAKYVERV